MKLAEGAEYLYLLRNDVTKCGIQLFEISTAVGAKYLARPSASRIGFIACGKQARSYFEVLRAMFEISNVRAYSRQRKTAELFAAMVRDKGYVSMAVADPCETVSDVDIVVTSVPHLSSATNFLDAPGLLRAPLYRWLTWVTAGDARPYPSSTLL